MPQRHDRKDGDDADDEEDAFDEASRHVVEREDLVLPSSRTHTKTPPMRGFSERTTGVEPATFGLGSRRSTN
jgi:hypothetical protein